MWNGTTFTINSQSTSQHSGFPSVEYINIAINSYNAFFPVHDDRTDVQFTHHIIFLGCHQFPHELLK